MANKTSEPELVEPLPCSNWKSFAWSLFAIPKSPAHRPPPPLPVRKPSMQRQPEPTFVEPLPDFQSFTMSLYDSNWKRSLWQMFAIFIVLPFTTIVTVMILMAAGVGKPSPHESSSASSQPQQNLRQLVPPPPVANQEFVPANPQKNYEPQVDRAVDQQPKFWAKPEPKQEPKTVHVDRYKRADGTWVEAYDRKAPTKKKKSD